MTGRGDQPLPDLRCAILAARGLKLDGILVEKMAARGVEMILGARRDPDWGVILMAGLGGIWTEALNDVRILAPDLDEAAIIGELLVFNK